MEVKVDGVIEPRFNFIGVQIDECLIKWFMLH
jgi:hypothetical protein